MKPRISMISLGVTDLEASVKFYRDGLGFPLYQTLPGVAFFNLEGSWLGLCVRDELAADAGIHSEGSGFGGTTVSHNVRTEKEVVEIMERAVEAGASVIKASVKADWGGFHGYFSDPDGYLWEVAYNPFFWIGPGE